jgi:hypothetical protein
VDIGHLSHPFEAIPKILFILGDRNFCVFSFKTMGFLSIFIKETTRAYKYPGKENKTTKANKEKEKGNSPSPRFCKPYMHSNDPVNITSLSHKIYEPRTIKLRTEYGNSIGGGVLAHRTRYTYYLF